MHVILWRFRARPGHEAKFEAAYGENGDWDRFFLVSDGYRGTELLRGTEGIYLTLDRWVSEDAYRAFLEAQASGYAEIDALCEALTIEETLIGAVDV